LVTNDPGSGSSKNKKAHALGIQIIDEKQFLGILEK
jgi:NAD-dependent DNA ligase